VGFVVDSMVPGQVFSEYFGFLASFHSADSSTLIVVVIIIIIILGWYGSQKQWPTYQVDLVSPNTKKLKKKESVFC
jgi:hypothetical protein